MTFWLFNIAMENGPFTDDFPIKTSIYNGFSIAMLDNQMVLKLVYGQQKDYQRDSDLSTGIWQHRVLYGVIDLYILVGGFNPSDRC